MIKVTRDTTFALAVLTALLGLFKAVGVYDFGSWYLTLTFPLLLLVGLIYLRVVITYTFSMLHEVYQTLSIWRINRKFQAADYYALNLSHPDVSQIVLNHDSWNFLNRIEVARLSSTSTFLLEKLSQDPDPRVRFFVAKNPKTSEKDRTYLLEDKVKWVQAAALANPNTPDGVRLQWSVRTDVIQRLNVEAIAAMQNTQILEQVDTRGLFPLERAALANPIISARMLALMARSSHEEIRTLVAIHKKTAPETLRILTNDESKEVAGLALERLSSSEFES